jgi:transposase
MRLILNCELNDVNPFDYLTELQRHAEQVRQAPAEWMPWNYHERLAPADGDTGFDSG